MKGGGKTWKAVLARHPFPGGRLPSWQGMNQTRYLCSIAGTQQHPPPQTNCSTRLSGSFSEVVDWRDRQVLATSLPVRGCRGEKGGRRKAGSPRCHARSRSQIEWRSRALLLPCPHDCYLSIIGCRQTGIAVGNRATLEAAIQQQRFQPHLKTAVRERGRPRCVPGVSAN